jgi:hypothetical protein
MRALAVWPKNPPRGRCAVLILLLCGLVACRSNTLLRSTSEERAFQQQYVNKSFYAAMVLRPYDYKDGYLIDLTGEIAAAAHETPRAAITIPLGTPVTITTIDSQYVIAHMHGHSRPLRFLLHTKRGTVSDVAEELQPALSDTPPLQAARPAMRPFISRQEVTHGMSQREIYMSWGQPDKAMSSPGASGFLEEWIYFDRRIHLFLHNGFLTNWQHF